MAVKLFARREAKHDEFQAIGGSGYEAAGCRVKVLLRESVECPREFFGTTSQVISTRVEKTASTSPASRSCTSGGSAAEVKKLNAGAARSGSLGDA